MGERNREEKEARAPHPLFIQNAPTMISATHVHSLAPT
ncbi:uncharacterized protein G2W53_036139 [Senna tora]|uniref:Uncharacterized protein n=1 Tax=Senna tora TaxID=362788 RepID=A0A834STF2_9FABA|nr:uncharacterized protein G2W53_036139 [Senna tora]